MNSKNSVTFELLKERYECEHQRKTELNNLISIPLGLISILIGAIVYFFNNLPQLKFSIRLLFFFLFLGISIFFIILCIISFFKHQIGNEYAYIADPIEFVNFEQQYIDNFKKINVKVNYTIINEEVNNLLYKQYLDATTINIKSNECKILYYRRLIIFIVSSVIAIALTFFLRFSLNDKPSEPIKIQIDDPVTFNIQNTIPIETKGTIETKGIIETNGSIIIKNENLKIYIEEPKQSESNKTAKEN